MRVLMDDLKDFKNRRSFNDRRKFSYTAHAPERRAGTDRREQGQKKFSIRMAYV